MNINNNMEPDFSKPVDTTVELKEQARSGISKVGVAYTIFIIIIEIVSELISYILKHAFSDRKFTANEAIVLGTFPMYIIGIPLLYLMLKRLPSRKPESYKISTVWLFMLIPICYFMLIAGAYIGNFAGNLLSEVTGLNISNRTSDLISQASPLLIAVVVVIVGPLMEEIIYRKLMIDKVMVYSPSAAVFLSGLCFAFFHTNIYQFFYAFFIGLVFGIVYINTGRLRYTFFLHACSNALGSLIPMYFKSINNTSYLYYLLALAFVGLILLIANLSAFRIEVSNNRLPLGKAISASLFAPGMFAFFLLNIVITVLAWFAS